MRIVIICLFLSILLIGGCKNSARRNAIVKNQSQQLRSDTSIRKRNIAPEIIDAVRELAHDYDDVYIDSTSLHLNGLSFAVVFKKDDHYKNQVLVTYYGSLIDEEGEKENSVYEHTLDFKNTDYRGSTNVNGHKVLIFDRDSIGSEYYNLEYLINIPLSEIRKTSLSLSLVCSFDMEETGLIRYKPML